MGPAFGEERMRYLIIGLSMPMVALWAGTQAHAQYYQAPPGYYAAPPAPGYYPAQPPPVYYPAPPPQSGYYPPPPPQAAYAQVPVGRPASPALDPNNCGTPDEPKACPPMPRVNLPYYPANR